MQQISQNALHYALRELSRRAGVTSDFFRQWRIESQDTVLRVRFNADSNSEIRFPSYPSEERQRTGVVRKAWGIETSTLTRQLIPDLIVPFCRRDSIPGEPLFVQEDVNTFRCTEDLLPSLLWTMCRREEVGSQELDVHGRFPATAGIASRHGFLGRPIVDEYGLALESILKILLPSWQPEPRAIRVKLSHDVDELGIPFSFRTAAGHATRRFAPLACAQDLLSPVSPVEPAYLQAVRRICKLSLERGFRPALYWKGARPSTYDTGYDLNDPKIGATVNWANEQGIEMGVHPGYESFRCKLTLEEEVRRYKIAIRGETFGGRQDFLRWCPETWSDWETCGISYDSSVGFADQVGFRSGTSYPFLPWLWEQDRPANLLEIPLIAMDATLVWYMRLNPRGSLNTVRDLYQKCSLVGGVFTLLWHNSSLFAPYGKHYLPLLDFLSGTKSYDWETDFQEFRDDYREISDQLFDRGKIHSGLAG
jgi:hypothetical protein